MKIIIALSEEQRKKAVGLLVDELPDIAKWISEYEEPTDAAQFRGAVDTDETLEVDDDAPISRSDYGAFVNAWVWVSNEEAGIEGEEL